MQNRGCRGGKDDIDPRALNAHELDGKEAYRSAYMKGKQREDIKLHFFEMHTVAVGYILRKSKRGLLCVVGGEYGRAYKALSAGKGAPLHTHRKEYGVQREDDIRIGRNEAQGNTGKRVDNRRCTAHIDAEKVRQEHCHHRACNVQHERAQMQQHRDRVAAQRIERKLQQVHGLRAGKYSAAAQYRIRTEKSADRGKRQVPVQIGIFIYKQYYRPVSIEIVPNEQK